MRLLGGYPDAWRPGLGLDRIAAEAGMVMEIEIGLEAGRRAVVLDVLYVETRRQIAGRWEVRRVEGGK